MQAEARPLVHSSTCSLINNIKDYDNKELEFKDNGDQRAFQKRDESEKPYE
jgi:hypothetical protein